MLNFSVLPLFLNMVCLFVALAGLQLPCCVELETLQPVPPECVLYRTGHASLLCFCFWFLRQGLTV